MHVNIVCGWSAGNVNPQVYVFFAENQEELANQFLNEMQELNPQLSWELTQKKVFDTYLPPWEEES